MTPDARFTDYLASLRVWVTSHTPPKIAALWAVLRGYPVMYRCIFKGTLVLEGVSYYRIIGCIVDRNAPYGVSVCTHE